MLDSAEKTAIITQFRRDEKDTGSPEIQIAVLTKRIAALTEHLKALPKDFHSRRGLYGLVAARRKHLAYLKRTNLDGYRKIVAELGLRG
ncbi:MAG: 30S ribosomal protein S15 [Armatimonadetes bacterium]|nr:30S ribosomal protein S15 [Armatimonadota bacterium]